VVVSIGVKAQDVAHGLANGRGAPILIVLQMMCNNDIRASTVARSEGVVDEQPNLVSLW